MKNSVCKTLINRAKTICEVDNIEGELEHLRSVLKMNVYPKKFIDNAIKTRQQVREKTEYQSSAGADLAVFVTDAQASAEGARFPGGSGGMPPRKF